MRRSISGLASRVASSQQRIHSVQTNRLPRSVAKLERSEKSVTESIGRQLETTQRILDPDLPLHGSDHALAARDCSDCGTTRAMKLQNVVRTQLAHVPLLYVCAVCGAILTIPPRISPVP